MERLNAIVTVVVVASVLGCTDAAPLRETPISVSGKLTQGGRPVSNVVVCFHPLDEGYLKSFPVQTDGSFTGELIGGNYSYYVDRGPAANSAVALAKIDPKYHQPELGRSVTVEFGKEIALVLD